MQEKSVTYKTGDGRRPADLTIWWDINSPFKSRPIVLMFHGGAFVIGSRFMISSQPTRDLVDAGFVVVSADYSLCPQVSLYDGPEQDAKDAYRWCKEKLPSLLAEDGIVVDSTKVMALGYSSGATLALCLGGEIDPPVAIVDFYGAKLFRDSFWFTPLPMLAQLPDVPGEFLDKIFDEPIQTSTANSLEAVPEPQHTQGRPKKGLPPPDLSRPRNAWLFSTLKDGSHLTKIVQDGDFDRVDPVRNFTAKFPPTFFVHGLDDTMILPEISEEASERLKELGVETGTAFVPGASHGFDLGLGPEDPQYQYVQQAIKFLKQHAQ
ncbi:Alpha/Beta hydrolase protein [Hypoxylon crocopeplum]|nr:Alpha/Beta hydrolase protein [Hypoxylon crocopeplum]